MATTEERIREKLRYEPETGKLFWKEIDAKNEWDLGYNTRFANKEAGSIRTSGSRKGYREVYVCGKSMCSHRIAWLLYYGVWPDKEIDHINHIRDDNRICNLRLVDRLEQVRNSSRRKTNTSGVSGVSFQKSTGNWIAYVNHNRKRVHLGSFKTKEEAIEVRYKYQIEFGYSETHGQRRNKY